MAKGREIKLPLPAADDLFSTQEERDEAKREFIADIPLTEISDFPDHPYKVKQDESMLELATDVCRDINQAAGQFSAMQKVVLQAATDHHLEICGGGTHPFQKWQRQEVCDNERYQRTLENFGYLIQQATVFGQHVHVGCASGDDAIYLLHGLSRFVPHFIALSAASPYMQGTDTRFASSRPNIFSAFPDNGPMPWVSNWQQFEALFRCLSYTTMIDSIKDLHWDIRPSR